MRKTILLFTVILFLNKIATAQKMEYSINLNSGFYHFAGENSSGQTGITLSPGISPFIYNSPGRKSGFSYEGSLQGQRVTRKKIIYGVELAYQSLQSKVAITSVSPSILSSAVFLAEGNSRFTNSFIAIEPFAGYRLVDRRLIIDLKAGSEYALCINRREEIDATISFNGSGVQDEHTLSNKRPDIRMRIQAVLLYQRFGINAGYFMGLSNYYDDAEIGHPKAYSRFFRLGLSYRIR